MQLPQISLYRDGKRANIDCQNRCWLIDSEVIQILMTPVISIQTKEDLPRHSSSGMPGSQTGGRGFKSPPHNGRLGWS